MRALTVSRRLFSVLLGFVVASFIGCNSKSAVQNKGGGRIGERLVNFDLDGPGAFTTEGDAAGGDITFEGGKVTVQKTKLLVDGKEVAKVPADAKVVLVEHKGGKLTVSADGKNIYSSGN